MKAIKDEATGRWSLTGVEDEAVTYSNICKMLKENKPFKFARYGDGEINCMNGKIGRNCDQHEYFPELGIRLIETVKQEPDYMVGIQPLSVSHLNNAVKAYFEGFRLYNADVLHNASIDSRLKEFFNALESRYIILVGPPHLAALFDECVHIVISPLNAWQEYKKIKNDIAYQIEGVPDPVVLLSCGMMAEVLIYDFRNEPITIIDTGSVFDPYVGVKSRKYHHKL